MPLIEEILQKRTSTDHPSISVLKFIYSCSSRNHRDLLVPSHTLRGKLTAGFKTPDNQDKISHHGGLSKR